MAFVTAHRTPGVPALRSTVDAARRYKRTGTLFLRDRQKHFFLDDVTVSKWVRLRLFTAAISPATDLAAGPTASPPAGFTRHPRSLNYSELL